MLRRVVSSSAALALACAILFVGAAPATTGSRHLNRIYRGDDGSALYTRQLGTWLYAFGEHPGSKLAFVFRGKVEGSAVTETRWWDVPKGSKRRVSSGTMELRWSQGGARLVRVSGTDLGPEIWQAVSAAGIPWPNKLTAGFQATVTTDLTGTFSGDDLGRYYVREVGGAVVWVAEKESQPGERPGWVSVFVGNRTGSSINGSFAHVEKGVEASESGNIAVSVRGERTLQFSDPGSRRKPTLTPDYALDFGIFEREIEEKLSGTNSVGWSFAIAKNGVITRKAGGLRLLASNGGPKPFTTKTMSQAASTSKTLTAALLMRVLLDRGVSVEAKVASFLPSCWTQGKRIGDLTFRNLLDHTSGFDDARQSCNDPYDCLQKAIANGQFRPKGYQNINYTLMRALVPLVDKPTDVRKIFESRGCANTNNAINQAISTRFWARLKGMLDPHGVRFDFFPTGSADYACVYDNLSRRKKGICPRADFFLRAGAGYIAISAWDFAKFLSAFDRGLIVPKATAEAMKTGRLGFDSAASGKAGSYEWKNGGCPTQQGGISCSAMAMIFPGDVQAYAMTNSGRNGPSAGSQTLDNTLQAAFDAALR